MILVHRLSISLSLRNGTFLIQGDFMSKSKYKRKLTAKGITIDGL